MKHKLYIFLACTLLFFSCKKEREHAVDFYYWKTNVSFSDTEKDYFEELGSKKLYIRFFDVDNAGNGIYPQAKIRPFDPRSINAEYVPVVFITNRSFIGIGQDQIDSLAVNINSLISEICAENKLPLVKQIQIDCDWTESTKIVYFSFLKKLKTVSGKELSCTIRLHQIAYKEKTGVPPVDKGFLMCYATSQPTEFSDNNSILDMKLLKSYTQNINDYPLPFNIALPLYSWAVVTNHLGKAKLINGITAEELSVEENFKILEKDKYEVLQDLFFHGLYLNKGFQIKVEGISPQLLREAKSYLDNKIERNYAIVYYHLDKPFLERFSIKDLK